MIPCRDNNKGWNIRRWPFQAVLIAPGIWRGIIEITGRDRMIILLGGNVLIPKNCNEKRGGG